MNQYTIVNTAPFSKVPVGRNLISSLGFFDDQELIPDYKLSFDHVVGNDISEQSPVERFNYSEFTAGTMPKFSTHAIEIPHFVEKNFVGSADYNGIRAMGGRCDQAAVKADLVAQRQVLQYQRYLRTTELAKQRSLFENKILLDNGKEIDIAAELGIQQATGPTLDLTDLTTHPMKTMSVMKNNLVKSLGQLSNQVTGLFVFLGDAEFSALKYSPELREDYRYVMNPSVNPLTAFNTELEVYESMTLNGVTYINVSLDAQLSATVGSGRGFMVPRFDPQAGVMTQFSGKAIRQTKINHLADWYSYYLEDPYGQIQVESEYSQANIVKLPSSIVSFPITM